MGDRSSIIVKSLQFPLAIQFYGHWSAEQNVTAVTNVLSTTQRVGDAGYLAAQLFHEFSAVLGGYQGVASQTGYGIYVIPKGLDMAIGDDNPTVTVNADDGTVEFMGERYGINAVVLEGALFKRLDEYAETGK